MTTPTELHRFPDLPTEIRLAIWELIPFPTRIIGLVPDVEDWREQYENGPRSAAAAAAAALGMRRGAAPGDPVKKQPYQFHYIVQPRETGVFPLLHVCRETRLMWLPRLHRLPAPRRAITSEVPGTSYSVRCTVQYDTPFINYDTDIITAYEAWMVDRAPLVASYLKMQPDGPKTYMDPLLGMERSRIRHLGIAEMLAGIVALAQMIDLPQFSALQTLTFITLGPGDGNQPTPRDDENLTSKPPADWLEQLPAGLAEIDCVVRDVPSSNLNRHPLLDTQRLRHGMFGSPEVRPLFKFMTFCKAWLWHSAKGLLASSADFEVLQGNWWYFLDYVFNDSRPQHCSMPIEFCERGGHSRREMLDWEPPFEIRNKILCPEVWLEAVEETGLFDKYYIPRPAPAPRPPQRAGRLVGRILASGRFQHVGS